MSFFKRVTATVNASIDRAISQIENNDAVIEAALAETRDAAARLKVQVSRARAETARIQAEHDKQAENAERWTERARRVGDGDEARAIECLRRRGECRELVARLAEQLAQNADIEKRLGANLARLDERLIEINARRSELRGRELSAKGSSTMATLERDAALDVDRAFERWEVAVTRAEIAGDGAVAETRIAPDTLSDEFEQAEHDSELRAELTSLLADKDERS